MPQSIPVRITPDLTRSLVGSYADPNHPEGFRHVLLQGQLPSSPVAAAMRVGGVGAESASVPAYASASTLSPRGSLAAGVTLIGRDSFDDGEPLWIVSGVAITSPGQQGIASLTFDFREKGGPEHLEARLTAPGKIRFSDGNEWSRMEGNNLVLSSVAPLSLCMHVSARQFAYQCVSFVQCTAALR